MRKLIFGLICASIGMMTLPGRSNANSLTVIHSFAGLEGAHPDGALIQANDGNLYGTTPFGGPAFSASGINGNGVLYQLTPAGALTTVHNFGTVGSSVNIDGINPYSPVIQGLDGRLYGTAQNDGISGFGTVYAIKTDGTTFTPLHSFSSADGSYPYGGLVQTSDGTIFGTTVGSLIPDIDTVIGTVFHLLPDGTAFDSHNFTETDGSSPVGGLIQGLDGSIYGSCFDENTFNGLIFKTDVNLSPTSLYTFSGTDGANPRAAAFQAPDGSFYATTTQGGTNGIGTVVKITPAGALVWSTSFSTATGDQPYSPVIQASDGNLYGTTSADGTNAGTIYQVTPVGVLKKIYDFNPATDGGASHAALLLAKDGYLYGTTTANGASALGTVFRFSLDPNATSLTPTMISSGHANFTLTITGSNFNADSVVLWNGTGLITTYVSPTTITAVVPAADVVTPGTATVTVRNRDGGTSGPLTFTIRSGAVLTRLVPSHLTATHAAFSLCVFGNGFTGATTIYWNGVALPTRFGSICQLFAQVPASDVASVNTASVTVGNASSSFSNALPFSTLPVPVQTVLAPNTFAVLPAANAAQTPYLPLTVTGANFLPGATVKWNGASLPTVYVSPTKITATIQSARLLSVYPVQVVVASEDGVLSNSLTFKIIAPPYLHLLSPAHVTVGTVAMPLGVTGENFTPNTVLSLSGTTLSTTYVDANHLSTVIPAALVRRKIAATITATDPATGSASLPFTVDALHTFSAGLQLISVPVDYTGLGLDTILDVPSVKLAVWNPATDAYVVSPTAPADTFHQGQGVWARFAQATSIVYGGTDLTASTKTISVPLSFGWNLIGNPYASPLPLGNVRILDKQGNSMTLAQANTNQLVYSVLYSYNSSTGYQAHTNDSLQPYQGYWIQAFTSCTLVMPAP